MTTKMAKVMVMTQTNRPIRWMLYLAALMATGGAAYSAPGPGVQLDTMRCGRHVIEVGDQWFLLLDKCGDPDFRQVISVDMLSDVVRARERERALTYKDSVTLITEAWVYKQGRGRISKVLTVSGGILTDIRLATRQ